MQNTPYLRSSIARSMYQRLLNDQQLRNFDKSKWYECDLSCLSPEVNDKFVLSYSDVETEEFIDRCFEKSDWLFTQIFHVFAKAFLYWFMSTTSINGFLGRGSMFVYSSSRFESLLDISECKQTLLDIGAGDGNVTSVMSKYFNEVYVTEVSSVMRKILSGKGYKLLEADDWHTTDRGPIAFDVITCLNVLDRCDNPLEMLKQIREKLKEETGRLIVAIVLPLRQYVETGDREHQPKEKMPVEGQSFEEQVASLSATFFPNNGFEVVKWTKLPYICEGDLNQSYYWLDDAVFVLKSSRIVTNYPQ